MRMPLLVGQYLLTRDSAGGLLLPDDVRKGLDPERESRTCLVILGGNRKLWLYSELKFEMLNSQCPQQPEPDGALDFDGAMFALATRIEWDGEGRAEIPGEVCRSAELGLEIYLLGTGDHYEIWNRDEWETRRRDLFSRHQAISLQSKAKSEKENGGS